LLRMVDFWQLFCIMGILTGIGLMTINNIGHVSSTPAFTSVDAALTEHASLCPLPPLRMGPMFPLSGLHELDPRPWTNK
jgi:hypothetical protein